MRWFVVWTVAAALCVIGLLLLFMGPALGSSGKGGGSSQLSANLPLPLILVGLLGMVGGVAGTWRSQTREPSELSAGKRAADMAAVLGLVLAIAALTATILFHVGIAIVPGSYLGAPGAAGVIPAAGVAALPVALVGALISWPALVSRNARRREALMGVTFASLTVVWMLGWFLLAVMGFFGGD